MSLKPTAQPVSVPTPGRVEKVRHHQADSGMTVSRQPQGQPPSLLPRASHAEAASLSTSTQPSVRPSLGSALSPPLARPPSPKAYALSDVSPAVGGEARGEASMRVLRPESSSYSRVSGLPSRTPQSKSPSRAMSPKPVPAPELPQPPPVAPDERRDATMRLLRPESSLFPRSSASWTPQTHVYTPAPLSYTPAPALASPQRSPSPKREVASYALPRAPAPAPSPAPPTPTTDDKDLIIAHLRRELERQQGQHEVVLANVERLVAEQIVEQESVVKSQEEYIARLSNEVTKYRSELAKERMKLTQTVRKLERYRHQLGLKAAGDSDDD